MRTAPWSALPSSTALSGGNVSSTATRARRTAAAVVLGVLLLATAARAEPTATGVDRSAEPSVAVSGTRTTAELVLIGESAGDRELSLLFEELLERKGVTVAFARAERFDPDELFESETRGTIRVFVVLDDPRQARLRFRGPNGERYLLRKVTLSGGLDAVGRELLGQVVESSVLALLHSTEGLSRTEVVAALERDDAEATETRQPPPSRPPPLETERPSPERSPSRWELRVAARYAATWSGTELGASHGPGVGAGVRLRRAWSLGVELGADRRFVQTLSTSALEASLERTTLHALLEGGIEPASPHGVFFAIGPSLELTRTRPTSREPGVTAADDDSELLPAVRAELRYELALGHFLVGIGALVEASFVKTRYELKGGGSTELLAAPAPVRPGAAVMVGVRRP